MRKVLKSLGQVTAVMGLQWGDEGKGKITDILAEHFDVIARGAGGANAGHTVIVSGKKHVFHLLPAGSLHPGKPVVLGSGMVLHLPTLLEEIRTLEQAGIPIIDRLLISPAAHILFDFHKEMDGCLEQRRTKIIGTTKRGIGPAYMDKAARIGIRMERLTDNLEPDIQQRAKVLRQEFGFTVNVEEELRNLAEAKKVVASCVTRSQPEVMRGFLDQKKTILVEGAQAALLDIDHGTYPYVTSSSTTTAGALQGLGLPPSVLSSCIGVLKAYCTRVGEGDFPTEEHGERGERLRKRGGEYGATTGRPRRCGWLSIPETRYAAFLNGCTHLNITKMDVLDEEAEIPLGIQSAANGTVQFEVLKGWKMSTARLRTFKDLPEPAKHYIERIEREMKIAATFIGTGPERDDMIVQGE
jgi:adenylosuccinate synthase